MRLELIFFIGIFANILLAMIFPFELLPQEDAKQISGTNTAPYTINNGFNSELTNSTTALTNTLGDNSNKEALVTLDATSVSILDAVSNFFDGLFEGIKKIKTYFMLLLPFGAVLGLMPGAIGFMLQMLYMAIATFAIIKFIRSG